ncbi:uncharacterized protein K489DRAFT_112496 [Dissoconium aciculare CBS 342.82]|uniref:Uncharacterized protein n=1 Tax=Dissoconium aciculare CBS 342.82 TaxID=1314786 RepID=A0A6J3MHE6_9PEZI|nr:uncharacterized protein K489DRAFT_112496 [Dissoconium aciculare CBS 342.82]KAF1826317.1 hypothetical protein K489DRAFT_112496 [Dissoconium aciculare CBS 342.82]
MPCAFITQPMSRTCRRLVLTHARGLHRRTDERGVCPTRSTLLIIWSERDRQRRNPISIFWVSILVFIGRAIFPFPGFAFHRALSPSLGTAEDYDAFVKQSRRPAAR